MSSSAKKTATSITAQSCVLFFENTIQYTLNLCPADSEIVQLMHALDDVRFHGANKAEIRGDLSGDVIIAFDPIADQIMHAYDAYVRKCEDDMPDDTDKPIPLGGMAVKPSSLKLMSMVAEGTEAACIFNALYQVCFKGVDPDEAEIELPKRAKMVFTVLRDLMGLGSDKPKLSRSEINRINANKRWAKKREAEASALKSETVDLPAAEVIHDASAISKRSDTDVDNSPDVGDYANSCKSDANCQNDASDVSFLNTKIKKNNNNNNSHSTRAHENETSTVVQRSFDDLWEIYPKKEGADKAYSVYAGIVGRNPDAAVIAEIQAGLNTALDEDRRFLGEYRYIPQLSNWLRDGGWKAANVIHLQDPEGLYTPCEFSDSGNDKCFSSAFNTLVTVYGYEATMALLKDVEEQHSKKTKGMVVIAS